MPMTRDGDRTSLTKNQKKILKKLEAGFKTKDSGTEPHFFVRDDAVFISGEYGDGLLDYYQCSFIHPEIQALAKSCGVFAEWENPACIAFYDI